jgi:cysteine-rich repeat protein
MVWRMLGAFGAVVLLVLSSPAAAQICSPGDFTPPALSVTSPARSSALTQGGTAIDIVTVEGTALDTQSTVTSVTVNGVEAVFAAGSFSIDTASRWGLNTVVAVARDACGNEQTVVRSYLRSGNYLPATTTPEPAARLADSLLTQLNFPAIDDGERSSLDDAASIAENAIPPVPSNTIPTLIEPASTAGCQSITDNWLPNQNRVRVRKTSFAISDVEISNLVATDAGLLGTGVVQSFSLGIVARAYTCVAGNLTWVEKNGTINADNASITFLVDLIADDGELIVEIVDVAVDFTLTASINCTLQAICNAAINLAIPFVKPLIQNAVADALTDPAVNDQLAEFIVQTAMESQSVAGVEFEASLDQIDLADYQVLLISSAQSYPSAKGVSIPVTAPGSIHRNEPIDTSTAFALAPYEMGTLLTDDVLNQFLWAVWYGGGLAIADLTAEAAAVGFPLDEFSHDAGLPQVLMPGGAPGRVEIGKGDTLFTIDGDLADLAPGQSGPIVVTGYWSSLVGGTIEMNESQKRMVFVTDDAEARVEIVSINNPLLQGLVVPILEANFAALDVVFVKKVISQIRLPRTNSAAVGGIVGHELAIANAVSDRHDDSAVRLTGDIVESAICGDGLLRLTETCDDGNASSGDGCSASCDVEPGYACSGAPSSCTNTCGDSVVDATETCDDGGLLDGDGCSATCQLQEAYTFTGTALGGASVSLRVNGQLVAIVTTAGESAGAIAQRLANAINWEVTGVTAGASGNQLYVTGVLTQVVITDSGLVAPTPTPALGVIGHLSLIAALSVIAGFRTRSRRTPGS